MRFAFCFILIVQFNVSFAHVDRDSLLVGSKCGRCYVNIVSDTAFYEFRVIDKPSYFIDKDTMFKNGNVFVGKRMQLHYMHSMFFLVRYSQTAANDSSMFIGASTKEKRKWWGYKNMDRINEYINEINLFKLNNKVDILSFEIEGKKLIDLVNDLCPTDFDRTFFKILIDNKINIK